jgi:hypothetical protein
VVAQTALQYQMPRSQTHRLPLASHCDTPGVLQAVPMAGREDTREPMQVLVAPPVAVPPVLLPPVAALPPLAVPPVAPPPVLVPPDAVPPVFAPPVPASLTQSPEAQVSPELHVLLP